MNETLHQISYAAPQNGIAFRVENAILTLLWLRTFCGFPEGR